MSEPKEHDTEEQQTGEAENPEPEAKSPETAGPQDQIDALRNQLDRAKADLANIRKRQQKEIQTARTLAIEAMAAELLPVVDNFHLALGVHEQNVSSDPANAETNAMIEGLEMVKSLLVGVLERHGVAKISAEGVTFDPNLHEAVGIDTESQLEPGTVSRIVQHGYMLGDKVLRASRVMVSAESEGEKPDSKDD